MSEPKKKELSAEDATAGAYRELDLIAESRKELEAAESEANATIAANRTGAKHVALADCVAGFHAAIKNGVKQVAAPTVGKKSEGANLTK